MKLLHVVKMSAVIEKHGKVDGNFTTINKCEWVETKQENRKIHRY